MFNKRGSSKSTNKVNDDFILDLDGNQSQDISEHIRKATRSIIIKTVCATTIVFASGYGVFYYLGVYSPPPIQVEYELSGKKPLDAFENSLHGFKLDDLAKQTVAKKSWIQEEIDYANGNELRNKFIETVLNNLEFQYPNIQAVNKRGLMYDKAGNPVMVESDMLNGEKLIVKHIDYNAIATTFQSESDEILKLVATKGYKSTDYLYKDEMIDCMLEYIFSMKELPTKTDEIEVKLVNKPIKSTNKRGKEISTDNYVLQDDVELDRLLFSSDEFHRMCDSFAMVISGWKPNIVQQEQDNPEYAKYQRGIADGTISADSKAPDKKIMVNVVQGDSFPSEEIVPYTWLGSNYLQNEYDIENPVLPQDGDGTFDRPAGLDTYVVSKAIDNEGKAHDILLTLTKFLTEQDAIDYLATFDEQNRGISNSANVKMLCAEFSVKNLDSVPITITEDMSLCDRNAQYSSKTGNIYGLTETITLQPNETKTIQSWFSSTDLNKRYMVWGRSFGRQYPVTWFNVLASVKEDDNNKDGITEKDESNKNEEVENKSSSNNSSDKESK